jgi:hypothetical protein
MNLYNLPCIVGVGGNTNFGNCNFNLSNAQANILVPAGTKIPVSQLPTFVAYAQLQMRVDNPALRYQIIKGIKGVEKANIDAANATWGDGTEVETRAERVGRNYQMEGLCANQGLSAYIGKHAQYDVIPIFKGNVAVGTKATMPDGEPAVSGHSLAKITVTQYDEVINETQAMFLFGLQYADPEQWRNMLVFKPADGNMYKDLESLQTVDLTWVKNSPQVAGVYQVRATTACGQINMGELYSTELIAPALWSVKNQLGTTVPIETLTLNGLQNFSFTLDDASPAYVAGTHFTITGVAPSALAAADVEWYEFGKVVIPKGA